MWALTERQGRSARDRARWMPLGRHRRAHPGIAAATAFEGIGRRTATAGGGMVLGTPMHGAAHAVRTQHQSFPTPGPRRYESARAPPGPSLGAPPTSVGLGVPCARPALVATRRRRLVLGHSSVPVRKYYVNILIHTLWCGPVRFPAEVAHESTCCSRCAHAPAPAGAGPPLDAPAEFARNATKVLRASRSVGSIFWCGFQARQTKRSRAKRLIRNSSAFGSKIRAIGCDERRTRTAATRRR